MAVTMSVWVRWIDLSASSTSGMLPGSDTGLFGSDMAAADLLLEEQKYQESSARYN